MMTYVLVDVEADGPCPGLYSMIELGAVILTPELDNTFYAQMRPLPGADYLDEALAVTGYSREQTLAFGDPDEEICLFANWIRNHCEGHPIFVSDNNGFDWQFVNYYFWHFYGDNPFGHSSRNLADLYKGTVRNMRASFKKLRRTKHTHHPVDDARGNAEALQTIFKKFGFKL